MMEVNPDRIRQLTDLHHHHPTDPFIWFALAREFEKAMRLAEALQWYEKLYRERPDYVGTYYHWGKLLEKQGETSAAAEVYHIGIRMAQEHRDFHAKAELQAALEMLSAAEE